MVDGPPTGKYRGQKATSVVFVCVCVWCGLWFVLCVGGTNQKSRYGELPVPY